MQPPRYVYASSPTGLLEFPMFIALLTLQSYEVLKISSKPNLINKTSKNLQAADWVKPDVYGKVTRDD